MIRLKPDGEKYFMQIIAKIHKQTVAATYTTTRAYIPPTREEMYALKRRNV